MESVQNAIDWDTNVNERRKVVDGVAWIVSYFATNMPHVLEHLGHFLDYVPT